MRGKSSLVNSPHEQSHLSLWFVAFSALGLGACARSGGPPVIASSASQPAYAITYTDDLAADSKAITDGEAAEKQTAAGFGAHVDELKKVAWDKVTSIVHQADASGKSAAYAEAHGESTAVGDFWSDERDTIDAKVGGNAQYVAKQASCTADVAGAATFALNDTFDKEVRKRLRARNDAFVIIERNRTAFGPANAAALEKLADEVAETSYVVYVDLPRERERLRAQLDDKSGVDKTLGRYVEDEKAFQAEPGRTDAEKKASNDRIMAASKTRGELDASAQHGKEQLDATDAQIDAARKDYEAALSALEQKISDKQKGG
jgi:hypothetical protein